MFARQFAEEPDSVHIATLRKEIRQLRRNPWLCVCLVIFATVVSASLTKGMRVYRDIDGRQRARQTEARTDWLLQDTRSAHMATHHGTSLLKVFSPLFAFDQGVDPHLGTAVRLESHHQQLMTEPLSSEIVDPLRCDVSSSALLLEFVLPLLVIFLTFSTISSERELGTLTLILSSGLSWRRWLWTKSVTSLAIVAAVAAVPLTWLGGWLASVCLPPEFAQGELLIRFGLLAICLLLFLGGWSFLSLGTSARAKSSRSALITLLFLWAGWSVLLPRVAVEYARQKSPLPLQEDLVRYSKAQVLYGEEGNETSKRIYNDLEKRLLKEYGVTSTKELPLNFSAAKMIALEEHTDRLYDARIARLNEAFIAQDQFLDRTAWTSPYLAIRSVSAALAGADRKHQEAFYDAAEQYRRLLVRIMNEFDMAKVKPTKSKSGPEVWALVPEFHYEFPRAAVVLRQAAVPVLVLIVWFLGTGLFAFTAPPQG